MTKLYFPSLLLMLVATSVFSQTTRDVSVEISAEVQSSPATITLNWRANQDATGYFIYRKLKSGSSWGAVIENLPGTATQFVDTTIQKGVSYEYKITCQADAFTGYGYINSGIEIPVVENRGDLILVIDSTIVDSLSFEINRLISDLHGDGWHVFYLVVSRTASVGFVKERITSAFNTDPAKVKAVFLLGHVPVPYSGEINIDGHPDHIGAYPADVFYGEMNGVWTDLVINNVSAIDSRNHNVPEDGKFDQVVIPSDVELQVGRVDFFNLPAFGLSETELLKQYLDKDHAYRHGEFTIEDRALIDDNFGYLSGEAFAASAWKNAGPLVGFENAVNGDYLTDLTAESFKWSYGCGGGWYEGAGGIGSTADLANADLQTVFTMLFGSYFGDWDSKNNFLRAALAQGKTLTNVWSGRPHWEFHHMGLGETIGYSTRVTQNNNTLYNSNYGGRYVHIALMGDPTLRNHVVQPVRNISAISDGINPVISWTSLSDSIAGYHIYRAFSSFNINSVRINEELIQDTFFIDRCVPLGGDWIYMVRAVKLEITPSGSYYNMSQGMMDTISHQGSPLLNVAADFEIHDDVVTFTNLSVNANTYFWDFGDGDTTTMENPVHTFEPGTYVVKLFAANQCDIDSVIFTITIEPSSTIDLLLDEEFSIRPNPSHGTFTINNRSKSIAEVKVFSPAGELIYHSALNGSHTIQLDRASVGIYFVAILQGNDHIWKKIVVQ